MSITNTFDYDRPKSLEKALELMSINKNPLLLAGGTDVVEMLKEGTITPDIVIDLKGIESLRTIQVTDDNILFIGAGVTFSELISSETIKKYAPVFYEMARTVASVGVRNRATMVGNICSAVPCMDSGPVLMVYDSKIVVHSFSGNREIPVDKWFINSRKTDIRANEIVTGIKIKLPELTHSGVWVKLGRYEGEDLAQVNLAITLTADLVYKICYGSVGAVPLRAFQIENLLNGKIPNDELIKGALELIDKEIKPISDIRASKEYRLHMAGIMLKRGLGAAYSRLNGNAPEYGISLI